MDIDPDLLVDSPEQAELRGVLRAFFADGEPTEDEQWRRMAGELGVQGLAIPERLGGQGYTFAELAVALQEAGRTLRASRLMPSVVLAGHALLRAGDSSPTARYLPMIAGAAIVATVAGFEDDTFEATRDATGWSLSGAADFVLHGQEAGLVLVRARTAEGELLLACEPAAETCTATPHEVLDTTRPQARLEFRVARAIPVAEPARTAEIVATTLDIGRAALAAEQVGGADHALRATVAYLGERRQFGRPVGSFQAVKHRLADLLVEVEAARSAAAYAAACVAGGSADLPVAASAASLVCGQVFQRATAEYVQLHGGIGFTWEHPAHRYVRRARSGQVMFGGEDRRREHLATLLRL